MFRLKQLSALLLALFLVFCLFACGTESPSSSPETPIQSNLLAETLSPDPDSVLPVKEGTPYYDPDNSCWFPPVSKEN